MNLLRRRLLGASLIAATGPIVAQTNPYPSRPVTWVVPYPAGGFGDALSRLLAPRIATGLGQPVVVDNKPGAGGQIGAVYAKQQPADGYTVLYGDIGPLAMNAALYQKPGYDPLKDFVPVTRLMTTPTLLVVPASSRIATWADLQKAAAATGNGLSYGSYGPGSFPHVWVEMMKRQTGGKFTHIPYKGAAPAVQDLIGGQIDMLVDVVANSMPLVKDGKLRAIAVIGSDKRLVGLPQVPTLAELGAPGLNTPGWTGVMVRQGTPRAVIERLHQEIVKAVKAPEVERQYAELGIAIAPMAPEEFGAFVQAETVRWGTVIKAAAITLD
ncbi:tripartite tricarboxylate transporter substrate binding protein [Caenimonas sedimenti]|uniref:Tripartite tricarboxylate transporter substrate binding protein n=1 Tax=Caenimonas sedimenti TaxID=2596921 RepID=A0A562ZWE3_9BURK|nr:tripartite tricarboxylate transporter substrate binding protein [Caenimonas sedimenti]TWO72939.1 tripartite tricarboxylate transporter substrate binding protein [Caenimonas sedimenti]